MISIIICTISPSLLNQLSKNINDTIGVENEIIAYDNRNKNKGICEVYNICAAKAKYNNLLFIHEDVLFKTVNWGNILIQYLSIEEYGLLGISGSSYKSKLPGPWWGASQDANFINIIQHNKDGDINQNKVNEQHNLQPLAVIDGVFMACKKDIWIKNKFDEINLTKFHNYDIDFSISVNQTHKVVFINDILIEHLSQGSYNKDWIKSSKTITKKWKNKLPLNPDNISKLQTNQLEKSCFANYIKLAAGRRYSFLLFFKELMIYWKLTGNFSFILTQIKIWLKSK